MANQPATSTTGNTTNKRKRGLADGDVGRDAKMPNTNGEHDATTFGLLLQSDGMLADDNARTAQAALAAPGMNPSTYPEPNPNDGGAGLPFTFDDGSPNAHGMSTAQALVDARGGTNNNTAKPAVGSAEWHQLRKDNHKEVERRRREVINEGIENIAKIVPGTEKNKGAILQRTYEYIQELLNEKNKWDNERATFDIAIKELTSRLDRMKESARTAWAETTKWQSRCREAGLPFDDYDDGGLPGIDDEDLTATIGS
ncbi:uncharacterized protein Z520_07498 [Fonsecaea multimorphosa CBS 102226]|uniref:BHLH domain-containing protein n=1 Tax=Fonsecaea multimorphosa CBS 102226 TaxID=1442371 RepID=A0A0D2KJL7_9EURO|nr:uncharacterized protein Z520_07498 [Fonsecaea multimorphosa CBS 102226]KIX96778.1 hypothetical protein Z520_07498 [Fonsecaea multimorphosa CBS 102226]OAL22458.1 hypothetical protein AYO22_07016 [Fonsecaea multimorphosa]